MGEAFGEEATIRTSTTRSHTSKLRHRKVKLLIPSFDPGSGSGSDFEPGDESHREQGNITESDIDVGTDEIIIG
ncbi:hypothetical protein D8S78_09130 [Natrialba swarupiae]|nr:hypothetical protein [Natrialba swarupiae]